MGFKTRLDIEIASQKDDLIGEMDELRTSSIAISEMRAKLDLMKTRHKITAMTLYYKLLANASMSPTEDVKRAPLIKAYMATYTCNLIEAKVKVEEQLDKLGLCW